MEEIRRLAEELRAEVTRFTRELIAIPSFPGEESAVINRVKQEMTKLGYKNIFIDGMGNLLGQIGSGERILAYDGHADTVEIGNRESWQHDPFEGKLEDEIIYGRGACDQKGGVASMIYAGKVLQEVGVPTDITYLAVVSVMEELYEGLNWQYIIKENEIVPEAVILTEPSGLNISNGQRGRVDLKIRTAGISSHGAAPDEGVNAIYRMMSIVQDIEKLHRNLPVDPLFGKASITVTKIESTAPAINAVADSATIHVDRRLTRQDTEESVIEEIESLPGFDRSYSQVFIPEYEYKSSNGFVYPIKAFYTSWYYEELHPLVQTAIKSYKDQFGKNPELILWPFSTNGAGIQPFGIPTIGFGPGHAKHAHTVDDQVPVDHLVRAMQFYALFAVSWLIDS